MCAGYRTAGCFIGLLAFSPSPLSADGSADWFEKAVRYDFKGEAQLAFAAYRRAAEVGHPEAEFNVGVMLDSGRGVHSDIAEAATWYARAASHGNHRAAYNLGQLYEAGEGVPKNYDVARAWFIASDLTAGRMRLSAPRFKTAGQPTATVLKAPIPISPASGSKSDANVSGAELVWTSESQPEPARYYVELRAFTSAGSREVFSTFVDTSSVFAPMPSIRGDYAWRVIAVAKKARKYIASDWSRFSVAPP